jgi:hypothetical protein
VAPAVAIFISGAGIWFALGQKTSAEFLKERFTRLVLPLLFGIMIVIPQQVYFERLDQVTFTGSYVEFYPQFFNGVSPIFLGDENTSGDAGLFTFFVQNIF